MMDIILKFLTFDGLYPRILHNTFPTSKNPKLLGILKQSADVKMKGIRNLFGKFLCAPV